MNSWDCFDTLVARRYYQPNTVFEDMAEKLSLKNFTQRRKAAEFRSPYNLDSIYEELAKDYEWTNSLKEFYKDQEVIFEVDHCCPINENINRVQDGDLIVSDMYLPASAIEKILRKNGLTKDVKIYVSHNGKASGSIWKDLPTIDLHIGDNPGSDIASAKNFEIQTELSTLHLFTDVENSMYKDLSLLCRMVRLACPYQKESRGYDFWLDQAQANIPILILASLELPDDDISFIMRDGVHFKHIYESITNKQSKALHCSRLAFANGGAEFQKHVEENGLNRTCVDLHGTGGSITNYWRKTFQKDPKYITLSGAANFGTKISKGTGGDSIEKLNSSRLGSVSTYPDRLDCEFSEDLLEAQEKAVSCAISHFKYFSFSKDINLLSKLDTYPTGAFTVSNNIHVPFHH